ncbi:MAG TPA: YaiO family outer membrane beta-barrel protein [Thermoanaerobaculia bacterium]|nr:YaiO family outer membrane beta-barrel protein [Thermoanaerobaculia bacterium]
MNWTPLIHFFNIVEGVIVFYVAVINAIYLLLMILGFFALRRDRRALSRADREQLIRSPLLPSIAVLAPAYNEAATCRESVRAMLGLRYPNHEVIVINDGSKDDTLKILIDEFKLYKSGRAPSGNIPHKPIRAIYESRDPIRLVVIDKENGGKADSLNAGINIARADLVCAVDSDSLIEQDALLYVVKPFLDDDTTIASGGIIRVVNGCRVEGGQVVEVRAPRRMLPLFQAVEYLRAFLGGRVAFSFLNSLLIISGAFGLFSRRAVIDAGGYRAETVGEDMELIVRLHRQWRTAKKPYRIVFVPEPVCWTEVPETQRVLRRQRNRWQRGTVDSIALHKAMLFNPKFGVLGLFALPYFLLFEMIGPAIELLGYELTLFGMAFGLIDEKLALLFLVVSVLFGMLLSMSAVVLEELTQRRYPAPGDVARLFFAAVIENLGFRQLLTIWRTRGLIDGLRGKQGWGAMERRGFTAGVVLCLLLAPSAFAQEDPVQKARQLATAGHRDQAIEILRERLTVAPHDVDALTLYGIVLSWDGQLVPARRVLLWTLLHDPNNRDAEEALERIGRWSGARPRASKNEVAIGGTYDDFTKSDPFREGEVTVNRNIAVIRLAHARRFSLDDDQIDVELYPKIGAKGYAYLDAGYSPHARLYPRSRFGAELFQGFGAGFEASAGYRRLNFADTANIYTASLSKYYRDWLFTARAYRSDSTTSMQGLIRRYLGESWIGIRVGKGSTRDDIRTLADIQAFETIDAIAESYLVLRRPWTLQIRAGGGRRHAVSSLLLGIRY